MRISDVLEYMRVEAVIRGGAEYTPDLNLDSLDADWITSKPSNEDFHAAALLVNKNIILRDYSKALQSLIDKKAQERNYADGYSLATYVSSSVASWKQEADTFVAWRDACWQYAIDVQNQVESGQLETPSVGDFINGVPSFSWE